MQSVVRSVNIRISFSPSREGRLVKQECCCQAFRRYVCQYFGSSAHRLWGVDGTFRCDIYLVVLQRCGKRQSRTALVSCSTE